MNQIVKCMEATFLLERNLSFYRYALMMIAFYLALSVF
jgi:hypothetical protein